MQRLHAFTPFRLFMQYGYPFVIVLAVAAYVYFSYIAFPQFKPDPTIDVGNIELRILLSYIVMYAPITILVMSFLAWRVMVRHYQRLDEAREFMERNGGQASVDAHLTDLARQWVKASMSDNDVAAMDAIIAAFNRSADWYRRMQYQVRAFSTYHSLSNAA